MLTPEQIDQLSHPLIEIYSYLETEIINAIVDRLKTDNADEINKDNVLKWQMEKLHLMNDLNKDVIRMLSHMSGKSEKLLNTLLEEVAHHSVKQMDDWLIPIADAGLIQTAPPLGQDQRVFNTLVAFQKQAKDELNLVNGKLVGKVGQIYRDIISQTTAKTLVTGDFRGAVHETATRWADKGIPALVDSAGRNWSIEGYIPMVIKSTANNVANQVQFDRMDSYDLDLVEISSHMGARKLCEPYQGKIYSKSGRSTKYPPLASTSMGQPAGLFGINCHHHPFPYIEGVSKKTYNPYPTAENNKRYETFQQQRAIERDIRKAKRKLNVAQDLGDQEAIKQAKEKVRLQHARMRTFIADNDVTRRRDREQLHLNNPIVGGGNSKTN
jgi:hypothetical protein